MERELKSMLRERYIPADLLIIYDDRHTLWGGSVIRIPDNGVVTRDDFGKGSVSQNSKETAVARSKLLELISFLVEREVWKPSAPTRPGVPDETRVSVTVSVAGQSSEIWDWKLDLSRNERLSRIQAAIFELAGKLSHH